jgi:hypothetical protein
MDHLQKYIFNNKLSEFNSAFKLNPDKKLRQIKIYDDFSELKESKIIEIAKSAGVISNDIRKILDTKLGIRNSAGHPSSISISENKVSEFIIDLLDNVVLKY